MSGLSEKESAKKNQNARGLEFEDSVHERLLALFEKVERHQRIEGFSGIRWNVDFVVGSRLLIEASVQRRLETKINSTFIRFADIMRRHQRLKGALVVEKVHVLFHQTLGKKYFPTSEYRTFLSFGFPLLAFKDMARLTAFSEDRATALEISTPPLDFNARSMSNERRNFGVQILKLLEGGPIPGHEIARLVGCGRTTIPDIVTDLPQIKKVSTWYGLDEDSIYRALLQKRPGGPIQKALVEHWLKGRFLSTLSEHGTYRTVDFAGDLGVNANSLGHFVHRLANEGLIRRIGKGRWSLVDEPAQTRLA